MESKTIQQARGRISFLRTVKGKDELESALLAKGYISDEVIERNRELYDQCMEEADGETPLTQLELMTFGTWYYLHPEKVAGKVVPQTSFQMPIKVVGNTHDFIEVFGLREKWKKENRFNYNNFCSILENMVNARKAWKWLFYYFAFKISCNVSRKFLSNIDKYEGKPSTQLFSDKYILSYIKNPEKTIGKSIIGKYSDFLRIPKSCTKDGIHDILCSLDFYKKHCLPLLDSEMFLNYCLIKIRQIIEVYLRRRLFCIVRQTISDDEEREIALEYKYFD